MRRWLSVIGLLVLMAWSAVPALAADGQFSTTGRVVVSVGGDETLPADDQADAVVVVDGDALIEGHATAVVVVNGTVTLTGAQVETLVIVNGTANIGPGTTIARDVFQLNGTVNLDDAATVQGDVRSMAVDLAAIGVALGLLGLVLWAGWILVTLVVGLLLAAFASRQVRLVEWVISTRPLHTFLVGLAMLIVPPIVAVLLMATVVGLPIGLGLLLFAWPMLAFVGYLVGAIWIGEWILRKSGRPAPERRPYLASIIGLVVAMLLSLFPLFAALISLWGMGGVTIAGWRTLTARDAPPMPPVGVPLAG